MGISNFAILFSNASRIYFSEQAVEGQVTFQLSEEKKMRQMRVELKGYSEVEFHEEVDRDVRLDDGTTGRERVTEVFSSGETYFESKVVVYNGDSLPAGDYSFPFQFILPPDLPSSFEGEHGCVRYEIKAVMDRPWKFDHKVVENFTVNGVLDLNSSSQYHEPASARDFKNFCCWCCKSGPLSAVIGVNRTGFVPGENLTFSAEVDNQSKKVMNGSSLYLKEITSFKASGRTKSCERIVVELTRGKIEKGDTDNWEGVDMLIPPLPPSHLAGMCSIIDVSYRLDFHVDPSGVGFDLVVSIPITIGTIPLRNYSSHFQPPPPVAAGQIIDPQQQAPPPAEYQPAGQPTGPYPPYTTSTATPYPPATSAPYPPATAAPYPPATAAPYPPATAPPLPPAFNMYPNLPPPYYGNSHWGQVPVNPDANTGGSTSYAPQYVTWAVQPPGYGGAPVQPMSISS